MKKNSIVQMSALDRFKASIHGISINTEEGYLRALFWKGVTGANLLNHRELIVNTSNHVAQTRTVYEYESDNDDDDENGGNSSKSRTPNVDSVTPKMETLNTNSLSSNTQQMEQKYRLPHRPNIFKQLYDSLSINYYARRNRIGITKISSFMSEELERVANASHRTKLSDLADAISVRHMPSEPEVTPQRYFMALIHLATKKSSIVLHNDENGDIVIQCDTDKD